MFYAIIFSERYVQEVGVATSISYIMAWFCVEQACIASTQIHLLDGNAAKIADYREVTQDQLVDNARCLVCNMEDETHTPLFFLCQYIRRCFQEIKNWLHISHTVNHLHRFIRWIKDFNHSKFRRSFLLCYCCYYDLCDLAEYTQK